MQLKLYRDSMGVETSVNKFLMNASKGMKDGKRISEGSVLHIIWPGSIRI